MPNGFHTLFFKFMKHIVNIASNYKKLSLKNNSEYDKGASLNDSLYVFKISIVRTRPNKCDLKPIARKKIGIEIIKAIDEFLAFIRVSIAFIVVLIAKHFNVLSSQLIKQ